MRCLRKLFLFQMLLINWWTKTLGIFCRAAIDSSASNEVCDVGSGRLKNRRIVWYIFDIWGALQITNVMIVCSTVCSGADQRKHQSSASLAYVREITGDRWIPVSNAENVPIWWRQYLDVYMFYKSNIMILIWRYGGCERRCNIHNIHELTYRICHLRYLNN